MNPDLLRTYLASHRSSRRTALRAAGALGSAAALGGAATAAPSAAAAAPGAPAAPRKREEAHVTDIPFDYADPANLSDWVPSRYGAGDQRGAFNEITPATTAAALAVLRPGRPVTTYNLGELMWNGFPAYRATPPRSYEQRLHVTGYQPGPGFAAEGGILAGTDPIGPNRISVHEERFEATSGPEWPAPYATTYQIGTQLDNLNHVGAGELFYNGFRGPDIARGHGTTALGNENMGPVTTRGVLLDILGLKLASGDADALAEPAANGRPLLRENYRITVEDLREAMEYAGIRALRPGDAVLLRTGWPELLRERDPEDIARWEATGGMPGIYLREARWLAQFRPAIIASDTWALEVLGNEVNANGAAFPVHQDLLMRYGIRIGESVVSDGLAADGVHEFVYVVTPQFAEGATAGNTPPMALGQPRR